MKIDDLEYLETVSEASSIVGAVDASTSTNAIATYGFGYADAEANASGQQTSAITNTSTNVYVGPYSAITQARGTASAYARTDNSFSLSESDSIAVFVYGRSPY